MRHAALLDRERAVLVVIDLQEGYRTALQAWQRVVVACRLLVEGSAILGVPLVVTEQYPRGLGHTAPEAAGRFPPGLQGIETTSMSCCGAATVAERLGAARGIGARPRLEDHRGALLAVVGQRNQGSVVTFLALGKFHHPSSRPDAPARQSRIQPVECRQTLLAKQALARLSTGSASAPER